MMDKYQARDEAAEVVERECPCGAIIVQERPGGAWVDPIAWHGELCYPDAEGPDGEAVHEPLVD